MRARRLRAADGAVATEFVLIAPLLVVMFFGIVYIGLAVFNRQVLESATREGARVASVGGTEDEIKTTIFNAASGYQEADFTGVTVETCTSVGDDTTTVVANVDRGAYDIPFLGRFQQQFSATATFRCERLTP